MENQSVNRQSYVARKCLVEDTDASDRDTLALQDRALTAVSQIRSQFATMRAELEEARYVIATLRGDIRHERAKQRELNEVPVATLRRQIAFRLHPDRGGDAEIMSRLNALFDLVESLQDNHPEVNLAA